MKTYSSIEEYAEHVRRECNRIMGAAASGRSQRAGELAAALCTESAGIVQGKQMQQEQTAPDRFSLAMLNVHADVPSNSETGWERED